MPLELYKDTVEESTTKEYMHVWRYEIYTDWYVITDTDQRHNVIVSIYKKYVLNSNYR